MKAIAIGAYGGPETMRLTDMPAPLMKPDQILIDVAYAGLNPVDWKLRDGLLHQWLPTTFPYIPCSDVAGIVRDVGSAVTRFERGQRVYACCFARNGQFGTLAEQVALDAAYAAGMPRTLDFPKAAGFPLVALTAWQALHASVQVEAGQTVLISAAAGGVGSIAVQLVKLAGGRVLATASASNHDYVRGLGADAVIDYTKQDVVAEVKKLAPAGVDIVLDCAGGALQTQGFEVTKRGGAFISIVRAPDQAKGISLGIKTGGVSLQPDGLRLAAFADLIDAGKLKAPNTTELPLAEAAAAFERSKTAHVRGKLVLRVR